MRCPRALSAASADSSFAPARSLTSTAAGPARPMRSTRKSPGRRWPANCDRRQLHRADCPPTIRHRCTISGTPVINVTRSSMASVSSPASEPCRRISWLRDCSPRRRNATASRVRAPATRGIRARGRFSMSKAGAVAAAHSHARAKGRLAMFDANPVRHHFHDVAGTDVEQWSSRASITRPSRTCTRVLRRHVDLELRAHVAHLARGSVDAQWRVTIQSARIDVHLPSSKATPTANRNAGECRRSSRRDNASPNVRATRPPSVSSTPPSTRVIWRSAWCCQARRTFHARPRAPDHRRSATVTRSQTNCQQHAGRGAQPPGTSAPRRAWPAG